MSQLRSLLLVNSHSRQGKHKAKEAIEILETFGIELVVESPDSVSDFAKIIDKHSDRVDLVIVGGGDGTLNAAIEGVIESGLPLGILPLGTANDLARTLGIPTDLEAACRVIAAEKKRYIDLGCVNGKYFFNVASLGLSVQITQSLNKETKRRWGVLAYAAKAAQAMWRSRPFRAQIITKDQTFSVRTIQIAVGNGRYYGGGMAIAHNASIDDRKLDFYSLEVEHWWQILTVLPFLWQGRHNKWLGVRTWEGQEIEIRTRKSYPINTDGEITTQTPAKFRVIPKALQVIVPVNPNP
ncbi:MAG: lipid kinase [Xenococcaceae cyanobacterium]